MRKLALLIAIFTVTGMIPVASANHFSVGAYDSFGTGSDEAPNDDDRTVPGTTPGDKTEPFGIGTTAEDGCHDPSDDVSIQEIADTVSAHGFCGMLIYHEGDAKLQHTSTPDQDLRDPITTFDVVRAHTIGAGLTTCLPFCPDGDGVSEAVGQPAGGDELFEATHEVGSLADVTDSPGEAEESEEARSNGVSVIGHVTSPENEIQDMISHPGLWEMNGWWTPSTSTTFVAYFEEVGGQPIDKERLEEIVEARVDDELHPDTEAAVCGYTPDFQFTTVDPDASGLNCELEFNYVYSDEDRDPTTVDGYEDECETPSYVCGTANGPAWYSQECVCLGLTDPKIPGSDPLPGPDSPFAGPEGQTDYIRWHFVVAPHNSKCGGAQEPGFSFHPDGPYHAPYLAHDLDVYATAASTAYHDAGGTVPEFLDYADAVAEDHTEEIGPAIEQIKEHILALASDLPGTPEDVDVARSQALKEDILEPNLATSEPSGALDDTSRQLEVVDRTLDNPCDRLVGLEGDPSTVDPWVDYIDNEPVAVQDLQIDLTYASDERIDVRAGAFGNAGEEQDEANRPGPSLYTTEGKVGMFTDTDDDGEYDPNEAGVKYDSNDIRARGAYPMMWNMWIDESGQVDENSGCELRSGPAEIRMPEAMADLGYGPNTGLVQAVYLSEPTVFVNPSTGEDLPYLAGNNIYLMMSQAARELYDPETLDANPLDSEIDELVSELQDYAVAMTGHDRPGTRVPGEAFGIDAAIQDQCRGHTGNFGSSLMFAHDCEVFDCTGDTIATMYTFEVASSDGTLDGSEALPTFSPGTTDAYPFGSGQHTWYDIDPFDNDPDRSEERHGQTDGPPPDQEAGFVGEGLTGDPSVNPLRPAQK